MKPELGACGTGQEQNKKGTRGLLRPEDGNSEEQKCLCYKDLRNY